MQDGFLSDASTSTPRRVHFAIDSEHQAPGGDDEEDIVQELHPSHRHENESDGGHALDQVFEPPVLSARSHDPLDEDPADASPASEPIWSRPEHKVATFVLLLMEEFLVAYQLEKTARALTEELLEQRLALSSSTSADLWCEMIHSCRAALDRKTAGSSTLEKLVEFCAGRAAPTRKNFALELIRNPVSVCVSPKRTGGKKGISLMDAHVQALRSPVVRPSRRAANTALHDSSSSRSLLETSSASPSLESSASAPTLPTSASTSTGGITTGPVSPMHSTSTAPPTTKKTKKKRKHIASMSPRRQHHHHPDSYFYQVDKPHSNGHFSSSQGVHTSFESRSRTPGSYVEPALALAREAQLKHELSSMRILERELRHVRLEKIAAEPKKALAKRLGFASLSKAELQHQREKQDPYLNALAMEKLGFSKRAECALCQFEFLQVNLPHKVSFKCIMDVYAKWQYDPPDRAYATKYCAPLCYDSVNVCRMCAQIVFQQTAASEGLDTYGISSSTQQQQHPSARRAKHDSRDESFCSDPYALPPLFADDCYDEHDAANRYEDAIHDEHRSVPLVESPAKAIVYANQTNELGHFMTSKEWEVINPDRSFIREAVESTVKKSGLAALSSALANSKLVT